MTTSAPCRPGELQTTPLFVLTAFVVLVYAVLVKTHSSVPLTHLFLCSKFNTKTRTPLCTQSSNIPHSHLRDGFLKSAYFQWFLDLFENFIDQYPAVAKLAWQLVWSVVSIFILLKYELLELLDGVQFFSVIDECGEFGDLQSTIRFKSFFISLLGINCNHFLEYLLILTTTYWTLQWLHQNFSLFNTDKKSLMENDCMNYKCIKWSVIKQIFCIFY